MWLQWESTIWGEGGVGGRSETWSPGPAWPTRVTPGIQKHQHKQAWRTGRKCPSGEVKNSEGMGAPEDSWRQECPMVQDIDSWALTGKTRAFIWGCQQKTRTGSDLSRPQHQMPVGSQEWDFKDVGQYLENSIQIRATSAHHSSPPRKLSLIFPEHRELNLGREKKSM